jgi:hypothetical protein
VNALLGGSGGASSGDEELLEKGEVVVEISL